jgi:hypothetical protein
MNIIRTIEGKGRIFFGVNKETKERIYLSKPTFDCSWYWSFGYLGNKGCHYHLSSYGTKEQFLKLENGEYKRITEDRNKNMYDCLNEDYDLNPIIKDNLWSFCEQVSTIYSLKEAYEVLHRGGSHFTTHPMQKKVKKTGTANMLNDRLLPELMKNLWDQFSK